MPSPEADPEEGTAWHPLPFLSQKRREMRKNKRKEALKRMKKKWKVKTMKKEE